MTRTLTILPLFWLCFALPGTAVQDTSASGVPKQTVPASETAREEALKKQLASIEKQKQSIHTQIGDKVAAAKLSTSPNPTVPFIEPLQNVAEPNCPTIDGNKLDELVSSAARKQSLDPAILKAVIKQESGFKPCAISTKGAQGLMQLMPTTARELHVNDPFDPVQNVHGGAAYLRQLLDRYGGDLRQALVGYNAGPGRADQGMNVILPLETENYVANIFADLNGAADQSGTQTEDLAPVEEGDTTPPTVPTIAQKNQPSNIPLRKELKP